MLATLHHIAKRIVRRGAAATICTAALAGLAAGDARAYDVNDRIQLHGFVTQGWIGSTKNNFLGESEIGKGGRWGTPEYFQAGLNVQAQLLDNLRAGVQIFARDVGVYGNYEPTIDWAYLDYRFDEKIGLRAGRVRMPFGFHNDTQDVDSARTSILLPQSLYPIAFRDFMFVLNGVDAYGTLPLGPLGSLDYDLFGGAANTDEEGSVAVAFNDGNEVFTTSAFDIRMTVGGSARWTTPLEGLRVQASAVYYKADLKGRTNQDFLDKLPAGAFPKEIEIGIRDVVFSSFGAEYTIGDLVLTGEYGRWYGNQESKEVGDGHLLRQHRGYGQVSYRFTEWFEAGSYYSIQYSDDSKTRTHDVALSLRFDVNRFWNIKLEGHYIDGTNHLLQDLNKEGTEQDWLMFAVSTTVTF